MNAILRNDGNIRRAAKKILSLAGVASLALIFSGPTWAQSKPAQTETVSAQPAAAVPETSLGPKSSIAGSSAQVGTEKTTQAVAQNSSAKRSTPKGQQEGIAVHGHWIIDVRNPDGKVVSHREFENSLANGLGGGATLLAAMLGRTVTTGSWQIILADSAAQSNQVIISEPSSEAAAACPSIISNIGHELGVGTCSNTLSLAGATLSGAALSGVTVTLTGSGTVPQGFPAQIGFVETANVACATSDSPTICFNDLHAINNFPLTARTLDGQGTDPASVAVVAGQVVSVTVVISFGSGN